MLKCFRGFVAPGHPNSQKFYQTALAKRDRSCYSETNMGEAVAMRVSIWFASVLAPNLAMAGAIGSAVTSG